MYNFLEPVRKLDFVKYRFYFIGFSLILITIGFILFFVKGGFKQSIDFAGGTRLEIKVNDDKCTIDLVREVISSTGVTKDVTYLGDPSEKIFLISIGVKENYTQDVEKVKQALVSKFGDKLVFRGENTVGPRLSREFFKSALILSIIVGFIILGYIWVRFDLIFGLGAIASLIHDLFIMLTVALVFDIEMDITIIAAILTILGYSVTDTVVVYDRIRENLELSRTTDIEHIVNISIRQVIVRSILTSFTTLLIIISFMIWGPENLKGFSTELLAGIISGTYSSLFIAAPIVIGFEKRRLIKKEKTI